MQAKRRGFFYGWVIVAVAFIGAGFSSGIHIWGLSVFVLPMTDDLGWSRTAFFAALTIRSLLGGFLAPFIGPLLDTRHGPRLLGFVGAIVLGVSLIGVKFVNEPWQFWMLFGFMGALAEMGSGFVVSQTLVPKWFVRRRGRALGIATMGTGLGALVFPLSVGALVSALGWRDAWLVLGLASMAVMAPLALLLGTRPEDVGLLPDGDAAPTEAGQSAPAGSLEGSITRRQAMATPTFWLLLGSSSLIIVGITGFQSNWLPYLSETGFSTVQASAAIAVYGALSGLSRPLWGLLGERVPVRYLMTVVTTLTGASILMLLNVHTMPLLMAYMTIAGLIMGGYIILQSLLTANYFGRAYLGGVLGAMRPVLTISGAVSPLLAGVLYDLQGDYTLAFLVAMAAWFIAGLVVLMARPPKLPAQRPVEP